MLIVVFLKRTIQVRTLDFHYKTNISSYGIIDVENNASVGTNLVAKEKFILLTKSVAWGYVFLRTERYPFH